MFFRNQKQLLLKYCAIYLLNVRKLDRIQQNKRQRLTYSSKLEETNPITTNFNHNICPVHGLKGHYKKFGGNQNQMFEKQKIRENNLIGVNCEYDEKMVIPSFYKDYFIISFDLSSITIYLKLA